MVISRGRKDTQRRLHKHRPRRGAPSRSLDIGIGMPTFVNDMTGSESEERGCNLGGEIAQYCSA